MENNKVFFCGSTGRGPILHFTLCEHVVSEDLFLLRVGLAGRFGGRFMCHQSGDPVPQQMLVERWKQRGLPNNTLRSK